MPFVKFSVALRFAVRECECDPTRQIEIVKTKTKTNKKHRLILEKCETHFIVQQRQYMNKQTDRHTDRQTDARTVR